MLEGYYITQFGPFVEGGCSGGRGWREAFFSLSGNQLNKGRDASRHASFVFFSFFRVRKRAVVLYALQPPPWIHFHRSLVFAGFLVAGRGWVPGEHWGRAQVPDDGDALWQPRNGRERRWQLWPPVLLHAQPEAQRRWRCLAGHAPQLAAPHSAGPECCRFSGPLRWHLHFTGNTVIQITKH